MVQMYGNPVNQSSCSIKKSIPGQWFSLWLDITPLSYNECVKPFEIVRDRLATTRPVIMGIINMTSDSFYDGGRSFHDLESQLAQYDHYGVDIIDIGGESSRPGATPVSNDDEIKRIAPALARAQSYNVCISVDTYKTATAAFALKNGAHIINDITGGECPDLLRVVAKHDAALVLMHKQGSPKTMQKNPTYDNPVQDIYDYLDRQIRRARDAGIQTIMIDPGIGFGKTWPHNQAILRGLKTFQNLGCPILIGTSNKSFIGDLTGAPVHDRLAGSIASALAAYQNGAHIFRVHHVKETIQAFDVFRATL